MCSISFKKTDEKPTEAKDSSKTDDAASSATNDAADNNDKKNLNITDTRSTLEERRKSLLDHHWAIPSKDR